MSGERVDLATPPITDHDLALARRTFSGTAWPVPQLIAEVDRLRAVLLEAYRAMDAACQWAANETAGVKTIADANRHMKGYDALLDAAVEAGMAIGVLRSLDPATTEPKEPE